MLKLRGRIEGLFEQLAHVIYRNRVKTLLIMLAIIGGLGGMVSKLTVDTAFERMLREDDPARIEYNAFRDQFNRAGMIVIAVKSSDIFNPVFLKKLKVFHEDIEKEVPFLKDVTSLVNARNTRGEEDTLIVKDLLEGFPEEDIDPVLLKKQVMNTPVYLNHYITEDGTLTAIVIETEAVATDSDDIDALLDMAGQSSQKDSNVPEDRHYLNEQETKEIALATYRVIDKHKSSDFSISVVGGPILEDVYNSIVRKDSESMTLLIYGAIIFFLIILFRRISGVVFPLVVVFSSMLSTFGIMAAFKVPFTIMSICLPTILTAIGIADAIHVLSIFYREYQKGVGKEDAVAYAMGHSGVAIVMTSMTTAVGFLSFSMSELSSIGELGIFSAVGVMLALVYTIIMLPALLALTPIKLKKNRYALEENDVRAGIKQGLMDRVLLWFADFSVAHPVKIVVMSLVIFIVSMFGMFKLHYAYYIIEWFPESMTYRQDLTLIDRSFKGVINLEVLVDTKKENGIYEPHVLNRIEKLSKQLRQIRAEGIFVGKVFSINDILKETNQALHGNDPAFYALPEDRQTIAQELLLFENSGSDDLEKIVDSQFSKTRVSVKIPSVDLIIIDAFKNDILKLFQKEFGEHADITITGEIVLFASACTAALHSMIKSYVLAFVLITVMMILTVGSVKFGMLSMIPNLMPIFMVMGLMGHTGFSLDMVTLMLVSIALGLVVDDTMHFMYNFRKYYDLTGDAHKAIRETMLGAGRALLITSLVVCAGFFIQTTATLKNSVTFGFFTGLVILFALLADFLLAPALMVLVTGQRRPGAGGEMAVEIDRASGAEALKN